VFGGGGNEARRAEARKGFLERGIEPHPHQLWVRSTVSSPNGVEGKTPAEIDLDVFQPCRSHLLKAIIVVKNDSLAPLVMLVKFLSEISGCNSPCNSPCVASPVGNFFRAGPGLSGLVHEEAHPSISYHT